MPDHILDALRKDRLVQFFGKVFIADELGISQHPALCDLVVAQLELAGHYYIYGVTDTQQFAKRLVILHEDHLSPDTIEFVEDDPHAKTVIVTQGGIMVGPARAVSDLASYLDSSQDSKLHNQIADCLITRDCINSGKLKINGFKPGAITARAEGEFQLRQVKARKSGKTCGYWLALRAA